MPQEDHQHRRSWRSKRPTIWARLLNRIGLQLTRCGPSCVHPVPEIAGVVRVSSEGARSAGVAKLPLRQACLAQAVEQMLGVLGALVEGQSPLYVDRAHGIDPQGLGCLSARLIEIPQLREIGGQPDV